MKRPAIFSLLQISRVSDTISKRLIAFVVLFELLLVLFAGLTLQASRNQHDARARVSSQNLATLLSHDLTASFDKIDLMLLGIKDETERQMAAGGLEKSRLNTFIARESLRAADVILTRVTDAGGEPLYGTVLPAGAARVSASRRDFFILLSKEPNAEMVVSKPLLGQISGKWAIVFARRINQQNGAFAGIVYASVALEHFQKVFSLLNLGPNGVVNLRDMDLATVVRYPDTHPVTATGNKTFSKEWPQALKKNPQLGTYFAVGLDNRARVLAYHKVQGFPFYIIVAHDPADFLGGWNRDVRNTLALLSLFGLAVLAFVWLIIRAWKRSEADAVRMAELSRRLVEVQESERRKLAGELHDVTSPNLAALQINLKLMQAELPPAVKNSLQPRFKEVRDLLGEVTTNLRDVCANLRPTMLDYSGLLPALDDYARHFSTVTSIQVRVTGSPSPVRLAPDVESLLFRIAQEAVTNAAKHAKTSSIDINLGRVAGRTHLTIQDRGVGFDLSKMGKDGRPGLGLLTMRERAEFAGGRFSLASSPGKGTCVSVEI